MSSTSTTGRNTLDALLMPYLVYKIRGDEYTHLDTFDAYIKARDCVRKLRAEAAGGDGGDDATIRLVFAADHDEAVALLREKRAAPILKEWEK